MKTFYIENLKDDENYIKTNCDLSWIKDFIINHLDLSKKWVVYDKPFKKTYKSGVIYCGHYCGKDDYTSVFNPHVLAIF